jgi:uncharacterized protein YcbX
LGREESTDFPDVLPLLIVSEASIEELNKRLREKWHEQITIERFRPNIIVSAAGAGDKGPRAWSEDD